MFQVVASLNVKECKLSCPEQIIDSAEREPIGLTSRNNERTVVKMRKKRRNGRRSCARITGTIPKMKLVKRHGSNDYPCDDITQDHLETEQSNGKDAPEDGDANSEDSDNSRTLTNGTDGSVGCCTDDDKHSEVVADVENVSAERTCIDGKVCKENDDCKANIASKLNDGSKLNDDSNLKWDSKTKDDASEITFSKANALSNENCDSKEINESKENDIPHCKVNGESCSAGAAGETACFEGNNKRCEAERCRFENGNATDNVERYNATTDDCDSASTDECVESRSTSDKREMGDDTRRNGAKSNGALAVKSTVDVGVENTPLVIRDCVEFESVSSHSTTCSILPPKTQPKNSLEHNGTSLMSLSDRPHNDVLSTTLSVFMASTMSTKSCVIQEDTTPTQQHHVHDQTSSDVAQTSEYHISQAGDNTATPPHVSVQTPRPLHADITLTPPSPTTPSLSGVTLNCAHISEDIPLREELVPTVVRDRLYEETTDSDICRHQIDDVATGAVIGDTVTEDTDVLTDPRNAAAVMDINDNTKCASDVRQSDVHHNGRHMAKNVQHERSLETASHNENIESFG